MSRLGCLRIAIQTHRYRTLVVHRCDRELFENRHTAESGLSAINWDIPVAVGVITVAPANPSLDSEIRRRRR